MVNEVRRAFPLAILMRGAASVFLLVLAAGVPGEARSQSAKTGPLIVAADSMQGVLDAIALAWQTRTGQAASLTYLAPEALAARAEQGDDADILVLSDIAAMDRLEKAGRVRKNARMTLSDRLVIATGPDGPSVVKPAELAAIAGSGKIVLLKAPAGSAARAEEAARNLGLWTGLEPAVRRAETPAEVATLLQQGTAKLALVYESETKAGPPLKIVGEFPQATYRPALYPLAVMSAAKGPVGVQFLSFMRSQAATKIVLAHGLTTLVK